MRWRTRITAIQGRVFVLSVARSSTFVFLSFFFLAGNQRVGTRARTATAPENPVERNMAAENRKARASKERGKDRPSFRIQWTSGIRNLL